VEGVPAHGRGVGLDDLQGPFQPKPFYNSMFILSSQFGLGQDEADILVLLFMSWLKKQSRAR